MDAIVYEYCPPSSQLYAAGNTNVVSRCSSVWWAITPEAADLPYAAGERRAAGASDDDDDRSGWMSGGPRAYRATMDFLLKPAERVLIVFTGVDADGDRPDALYDVRSGPELRLERSHFLASFVENCSRETNVFVHRGSRLNHLLQLTFIDSCLTLLHLRRRNLKQPPSPYFVPQPAAENAAAADGIIYNLQRMELKEADRTFFNPYCYTSDDSFELGAGECVTVYFDNQSDYGGDSSRPRCYKADLNRTPVFFVLQNMSGANSLRIPRGARLLDVLIMPDIKSCSVPVTNCYSFSPAR